jgi:hypothetical protein
MKRDSLPDPFHPPAPAPAAAPKPEPAPPAPAPASAQNALEGLLGKALEDTRAAIERAAVAEEARRSADAAHAQAEEEARRSVDAASAARAEADAAIARAVQAEQRLATPPVPEPAPIEKLADALLAGFEALEPACG